MTCSPSEWALESPCQEHVCGSPTRRAERGPHDPKAYKACRQLHAAKSCSLHLIPESSPGVDPAKLRLTSEPWI